MIKNKRVDLEKIKKLRKEKGLTYSEVASRLGFKTYFGYYYQERGRNKMTAETLVGVADILETSIEELLTD